MRHRDGWRAGFRGPFRWEEHLLIARPARPPARGIAVVFVLGIVGTLVPVLGWLVGGGLVLLASAWSGSEKAVAATSSSGR